MSDWVDEDSGVPIRPVHLWAKIVEDQKERELNPTKEAISWADAYAELSGRTISIVRNKNNSTETTLIALELLRKILLDVAESVPLATEQENDRKQ